MKETMGQIIRRLRKERNLTQEELAEQLGVTFQAVSKWENDTGMPDISQVVPIAHVFGISTDVLFGTFGTNDTEEVWKIVKNAQALLSRPLTSESLFRKYLAVKEGLKIYPNNTILLMHCLETGIALSYPETDELYDPEHAEDIYKECIRYANLVISYSKNISDVLRAHMIMVMLHSAYGNFEKAWFHAEQFPYRADFNNHNMYAYYAHWKKNYELESQNCQYAFVHYLEGMLNISTKLAKSYILQEKYKDAANTLETSLELIKCIFKDDEVMPPIHHREQVDIYALLAQIYLKDGDSCKALSCLEKMVNYDLNDYEKINKNTQTKSPLLNSIPHGLYRKRIDRYQNLVTKLTDPRFESLKTNERYQKLLAWVNK
ncbi:MAG: helix-turn-helix transcriptional regulator [Ruminococcaceae bacterium]|nr:helix-turn-helix transcriptional regulator [Oscillospiraceae bacterium]